MHIHFVLGLCWLSRCLSQQESHWVTESLTFLPIEEIIFLLTPHKTLTNLTKGSLRVPSQAHTMHFLPPTQGFSLDAAAWDMVGTCSVLMHAQPRSVAVNALWDQLLTSG